MRCVRRDFASCFSRAARPLRHQRSVNTHWPGHLGPVEGQRLERLAAMAHSAHAANGCPVGRRRAGAGFGAEERPRCWTLPEQSRMTTHSLSSLVVRRHRRASSRRDRSSAVMSQAHAPQRSNPARQFLAGSLAGVVASSVLTPLEVVKTRLQASGATRMRLDKILVNIMKTEGIRGLWRGVGINVLGVAPARAVHFSAYNYFKTQAGDNFGIHGTPQHLLAGAMASCTAATGELRRRGPPQGGSAGCRRQFRDELQIATGRTSRTAQCPAARRCCRNEQESATLRLLPPPLPPRAPP